MHKCKCKINRTRNYGYHLVVCQVAVFEQVYCVWGRPLLRNIFVSCSTVSMVILLHPFIYESYFDEAFCMKQLFVCFSVVNWL